MTNPKLQALADKAARITGNILREDGKRARSGKSQSQMHSIYVALHAKQTVSIYISTKNVHWFKLRYKELFNETITLTKADSKLEAEHNLYKLSI